MHYPGAKIDLTMSLAGVAGGFGVSEITGLVVAITNLVYLAYRVWTNRDNNNNLPNNPI